MSQATQSQAFKQELAEYVEYFNKYASELNSKLNILANSNDLYDLSEDFINLNQCFLLNDVQNELMLDEDFKQPIEKLNTFCSNYLTRVTFEQLMGNKFFKNSHIIIYSIVKYLLIRLRSQQDDSIKLDLDKMLDTVGLIVNYLSNSNNKNLRFELVDQLLLSIFSIYSNIFYYLRSNDSDIDLNVQINSIKLELTQKTNLIIVKISNIIDKNLHDLNTEAQNLGLNTQINLNKCCKHIIYIINNLKEAKMVITLWKMLFRLVNKNSQFIVETNSITKLNQDKQFIINKMYTLLDQEILYNLKLIKFQLIKISQGNHTSINDEEIQNNIKMVISSTNSQCTMTNNLVKDTNKIIRLISLYYKMFSYLISKHHVYLANEYDEKFYLSMSNSLGLITCIFLLDIKFDIDFVLMDDDTKSTHDYETKRDHLIKTFNEFHQSKLDFLTQIKPFYELLFNIFLSKQEFFNFLNNKNLEILINQMIEQQRQSSTTTTNSLFQSQFQSQSQNKLSYDTNCIENFLVFYLIYLNKFDINSYSSYETTKIIENVLTSLNLCQISVSLPNYLTFYDQFFSKNYDFNELKNRNSFKSVEFYDFILLNISKFIARLLSASNKQEDDFIALLIENLSSHKIEEINPNDRNSSFKFQPFQKQFSNDLLIFISVHYSNSPLHLTNYLKFICDTIEFKYGFTNCNDYDTISCHHLSYLLIQILDYHTSKNFKNFKQVLNNIEDYVKKNKMYICYSLIANFSNLSNDNKMTIDAFKLNSFNLLADLYKDLVEMLNDLNKSIAIKKNEQLLIKKTLALIETNYFQQLLRISINLLDYSKEETTKNNDLKLNEVVNKLSQNLIIFLKLNELNNIFKYFENSNVNSVKLNFDYYKTLNLFIVDSITLYSLLISSQNENILNQKEDLMFFFDFLIKHSKSSISSSTSSQSSQTSFKLNMKSDSSLIKQKAKAILNNVKFSSIYFLKKLQSKEIFSQKVLFDKIIEFFMILLNDQNDLIRYFSFETLSDYITNPVNNKLFVELRRQSNTDMKTILDNLLLRKPIFSSDIDNAMIINDRFVQFVQAKYDKSYQSEMHDELNEDQELIESLDQNGNNLNDTMNLIMSAMDTTISATNPKTNNREISYSPKLVSDDEEDDYEKKTNDKIENNNFNELISQIKKYSSKIIKIYEENSRCELMKTEIQELINYLSDSL